MTGGHRSGRRACESLRPPGETAGRPTGGLRMPARRPRCTSSSRSSRAASGRGLRHRPARLHRRQRRRSRVARRSSSFYVDDVRYRTVGTPTDFFGTGAPARTYDKIYNLGTGHQCRRCEARRPRLQRRPLARLRGDVGCHARQYTNDGQILPPPRPATSRSPPNRSSSSSATSRRSRRAGTDHCPPLAHARPTMARSASAIRKKPGPCGPGFFLVR